MYYLMGIFTFSNLLSLGKIGNTDLQLLFMPTCFLFFTVVKNIKHVIRNGYNNITLLIVGYFFICLFSVFFIDASYSIGIYLKNIVNLLVGIAIYLEVVYAGNKYKVYIYNGIVIGLIMNFVFVLFQYVTRISIPDNFLLGGHTQSMAYMLSVHHRVLGLFIEPSYLAIHLVTTLLLLYYHFRFRVLYYIVVVSSFLTYSPISLLLPIGIFVLFILEFRVRKVKIISMGLFIKAIFFIFIFIALITLLPKTLLFNFDTQKDDSLWNNIYLTSPQNESRYSTVKDGLLLFKQKPLGVGYGMAIPYVTSFTNVPRLHSVALAVLIEIGILGFFYLGAFLVYVLIKLLKLKSKPANALFVCLICYIIIMLNGSGIKFFHIWFFLGFSSIEIKTILNKSSSLNSK